MPNHPVSEENSLYSSGTGGERGGEDGPAAFALPEALPSPRIVVDWSQEGPYCHGHTPSSDNALRRKRSRIKQLCALHIAYFQFKALNFAEYMIIQFLIHGGGCEVLLCCLAEAASRLYSCVVLHFDGQNDNK